MNSYSFEGNFLKWLLRRTASSAVRRVAEIPIAIASGVGLVRTENQDRVAVLRFKNAFGSDNLIIVVCDGMGGMVDGAECAALAVAAFSSSLLNSVKFEDPKLRLREAALYANKRVFDRYRGRGGATLTALMVLPENGDVLWVNVGDSRIYKMAGSVFEQLSTDDTLAGQLKREPNMYRGGNELLQYIGMGSMVEPAVSYADRIDDNDLYLLSSDGIHFLPSHIVKDLLVHAPEPAVAARRLFDLAMWCGGNDNASLAISIISKKSLDSLLPIERDVVELWDAFGEMRFFGISPRIRPRYQAPLELTDVNESNASETKEDVHTKTSNLEFAPESSEGMTRNRIRRSSASARTEAAPAPVEKNPARRRRSAKPKEVIVDTLPSDEHVPQLLINFRKKGDIE